MTTKSTSHNSLFWLIIFTITICCFAVYGQVANHDFVHYDDPLYVFENVNVKAGITLNNIVWSFSNVSLSNWHPLTWLSYMLDIQVFGINPGAMLLENVVLHTINSILLFILLLRMTGKTWHCAMVSALFALHPLHVESVAWISERKDILSAFFLFATMYFYIRYTELQRSCFYILALITYALGLMSKPMLVTVPVLLLLLDYWPLRRDAIFRTNDDQAVSVMQVRQLFVEKLPFFLFSLASCAITVIAQKGALASLTHYPLSERISNSLNTYIIYLRNYAWPMNLSPSYPFPDTVPLWQPILSAFSIIITTAFFFKIRSRYSYVVVGWLWYLVTLLPVIGIIQVGVQSRADRYTYIPLIGVLIITVWGVGDVLKKLKHVKKILSGISIVLLVTLSLISYRQVSYWKDTVTLFSHAVKVTNNNFTAYNIIGGELENAGRLEEALSFYDKAISAEKRWEYSYINRAQCLEKLGRKDDAIKAYADAISLKPQSPTAHISIGRLLIEKQQPEAAISYLEDVVAVDPKIDSARYYLALSLHQVGRVEEAIVHYKFLLIDNPKNIDGHNHLGIALAERGDLDNAIIHFRRALELKPDFFEAMKNLEIALELKSKAGRK